MIPLALEAFAVAGCTLLVLAACTKLAAPGRSLSEPLGALGVPAAIAPWLPVPLGLTEVAAAMALLLERGFLASLLLASLALLFLGAGVVSLVKGLNVPCHCLGSGSGRLGWPQLVAFPFWIALAALPRVPLFASVPGSERWLAFLIALGAVLAVLGTRLAKPLFAARTLRIAIGPMQ